MEGGLFSEEGLRRVCLLFNNHDLYGPYRTLRLMLCECSVTDPDAAQLVIQYYLTLDELWWRASTRLRRHMQLSDDCVRRAFRTAAVPWLLGFLQGDSEMVLNTVHTRVVSMGEKRRDTMTVEPSEYKWVLHMGDRSLTITGADLVLHRLVEGDARYARIGKTQGSQ